MRTPVGRSFCESRQPTPPCRAACSEVSQSFWSLLQTNVLNQRRWATRQELRLAIVIWIERKYHRQRPQDSLGGLTPIEYENKITTSAAAAA